VAAARPCGGARAPASLPALRVAAIECGHPQLFALYRNGLLWWPAVGAARCKTRSDSPSTPYYTAPCLSAAPVTNLPTQPPAPQAGIAASLSDRAAYRRRAASRAAAAKSSPRSLRFLAPQGAPPVSAAGLPSPPAQVCSAALPAGSRDGRGRWRAHRGARRALRPAGPDNRIRRPPRRLLGIHRGVGGAPYRRRRSFPAHREGRRGPSCSYGGAAGARASVAGLFFRGVRAGSAGIGASPPTTKKCLKYHSLPRSVAGRRIGCRFGAFFGGTRALFDRWAGHHNTLRR